MRRANDKNVPPPTVMFNEDLDTCTTHRYREWRFFSFFSFNNLCRNKNKGK